VVNAPLFCWQCPLDRGHYIPLTFKCEHDFFFVSVQWNGFSFSIGVWVMTTNYVSEVNLFVCLFLAQIKITWVAGREMNRNNKQPQEEPQTQEH
jgi:hypothetical protein